MRQGRHKWRLGTGLGTPQTPTCISPSPQMSSPGLRSGDRLQPPIALGFVSSAPPAKIGTICSAGAGKAPGGEWGSPGKGPLGSHAGTLPASPSACEEKTPRASERCKRVEPHGAWRRFLPAADRVAVRFPG